MKLFIAFLVSFVSTHALAAQETKKGYLMKVDFEYQSGGKKFKNNSQIVVDKENKGFVPVMPAIEGVALLAQVQKIEKEAIHVMYMTVDTSKNPVAVQSMMIISKLGQDATLESSTETDIFKVKANTSFTTYKSEK